MRWAGFVAEDLRSPLSCPVRHRAEGKLLPAGPVRRPLGRTRLTGETVGTRERPRRLLFPANVYAFAEPAAIGAPLTSPPPPRGGRGDRRPRRVRAGLLGGEVFAGWQSTRFRRRGTVAAPVVRRPAVLVADPRLACRGPVRREPWRGGGRHPCRSARHADEGEHRRRQRRLCSFTALARRGRCRAGLGRLRRPPAFGPARLRRPPGRLRALPQYRPDRARSDVGFVVDVVAAAAYRQTMATLAATYHY